MVCVMLMALVFFDSTPGCSATWLLVRLASVFQRAGWVQTDPLEAKMASLDLGRLAGAQGLRWGGYGPSGLYVYIDAEQRVLELYMGSEVVDRWSVAVGKPSTPTPLGGWLVTDKAIWGGGFGARWNGISVPWGRYGIHGTNRPGSIGGNLSAGCVRMLNQDVVELHRYIPVGTLMVIAGQGQDHFGEIPRSIRFSYRGSDVMQLQRILLAENLYSGSVDGIFGAGTLSALRKYQEMMGQLGTGDLDRSEWEDLALGTPGTGKIWSRP